MDVGRNVLKLLWTGLTIWFSSDTEGQQEAEEWWLIFCIMTLCNLVGGYQCFGEIQCLHEAQRFCTWNQKENAQKEHDDQDGNIRLGKMSHRIKEHGKRLTRRSVWKTETDGQAWLLDDLCKIRNIRGKRR